MKIQYFGDPSNPKIVVLHPMLLDGKSMLPLLGELRNSHCVIAPDLTGHGTDTGIFQSAQQEAETLAGWLTTRGWIDLKLVFGASIGAVVAMQLIAMPTFKVHTAVLEGCPLHSNAAFLRMMATRMFLSKHRKAQQHPGLSAQRMTKIYGETLGLIMGYTFEQIRPETLQAIAAACSDCTFPNYPKELEAHLFFEYGSEDISAKTARRVVSKHYPFCFLYSPGRLCSLPISRRSGRAVFQGIGGIPRQGTSIIEPKRPHGEHSTMRLFQSSAIGRTESAFPVFCPSRPAF